MKRYVVVAVIVVLCISLALLSVVPTWSSPGVGEYDPWYDVNDDGVIDGSDIIELNRAFGSWGTPIAKASLDFDSGWINITDKAGQNVTIVNNLGLNMNDANVGFDITGKASLDDQKIQRYIGLTGSAQGWNKTYGGTSYDWAYALVQTSDGGYALAGRTDSYGAGGGDFWLVKTDVNGNAQWNKTYGGTTYDWAYALVQTSDGGYALAGRTDSYGAGSADFWLVKTDANGNTQWNQTYGGTGWEYAYALVQTGDGGYALAGYTGSYGAGNYDFWLVKTDANGNAQWNRTYGGTGNDQAYALVQTGDGGYALAGYTESYGTGNYDFWLVKTDAESGLGWIDSDANSITLHRGLTDIYWNYVRVRIWILRETP